MKQLTLYIFITFVSITFWNIYAHSREENIAIFENITTIKSLLTKTYKSDTIADSIYNKIKDNNYIFYYRGHDTWNWSAIVDNDSDYVILSGNTYAGSNPEIHNPKPCILLSWAFDSLFQLTDRIPSINKKQSWNLYDYRELIIHECKKNMWFKDTPSSQYPSYDSVEIRNKLNNIAYSMLYYSYDSAIQKKIPAPLIFKH